MIPRELSQVDEEIIKGEHYALIINNQDLPGVTYRPFASEQAVKDWLREQHKTYLGLKVPYSSYKIVHVKPVTPIVIEMIDVLLSQ